MNSRDDSLDPHQLMVSIEHSARLLDSAGARLAAVTKKLSTVQAEYEAAFEAALITIYDASVKNGARMPAEDVRKAMAHQQIPSKLYGDFLATKAELDALRAWTRATEAALSARQSLLSTLRAELQVAA